MLTCTYQNYAGSPLAVSANSVKGFFVSTYKNIIVGKADGFTQEALYREVQRGRIALDKSCRIAVGFVVYILRSFYDDKR